MRIKTFGYKATPGGYLGLLEKEWTALGHTIVERSESDYDVIFNIDRSEIHLAANEQRQSSKPLHTLVLDIPAMEGTDFEWMFYSKDQLNHETTCYEVATSILTISQETSRNVKKYFDLESRCVGIPALSHEQCYEDRSRNKYVYYFGRAADPIKNIVTLIQALKGTEYELYIPGDPYLKSEIFDGMGVKVKNWGMLPREKVNMLIKHAHVLVDPAMWHGLGMQPIEGVLMGTACINADIQVKRDVWDNVLPSFEAKNVDQLRELIVNFDHQNIDMKAAQQIAEWYLPNRVAERILRHMEK